MAHCSGSDPTESHSAVSTPPVSAAALRNEVAALAPTLEQNSPSFRCAVLLLAARRIGQNIDRLARFTGYPREFVARCARRLCDNGVWRNGETVCNWSDVGLADGSGHAAFWADVDVADGRMCRRSSENGEIEWARAGCWTKSYEYKEQEAHPGPGTRYLSSPPQSQPSATHKKNFLDHLHSTMHIAVADAYARMASGAPILSDTTNSATGADQSPNWPAMQPGKGFQPLALFPELFTDAGWLA